MLAVALLPTYALAFCTPGVLFLLCPIPEASHGIPRIQSCYHVTAKYGFLIPVLQTKKLRFRKLESRIHVHTASKWQSKDFDLIEISFTKNYALKNLTLQSGTLIS